MEKRSRAKASRHGMHFRKDSWQFAHAKKKDQRLIRDSLTDHVEGFGKVKTSLTDSLENLVGRLHLPSGLAWGKTKEQQVLFSNGKKYLFVVGQDARTERGWSARGDDHGEKGIGQKRRRGKHVRVRERVVIRKCRMSRPGRGVINLSRESLRTPERIPMRFVGNEVHCPSLSDSFFPRSARDVVAWL